MLVGRTRFFLRNQELLSAIGISLVLHVGAVLFAGKQFRIGPGVTGKTVIHLSFRSLPATSGLAATTPGIDRHEDVPPSTRSTPADPHGAAHVDEPETVAHGPVATSGTPHIFDIGPRPYVAAEFLSERPAFVGRIDDILGGLSAGAPHGRLVVTLYLSDQGVIDRVEIDSSPELRELAQHIETAVRRTPIRPGLLNGRPVRSRWVLEFTSEAAPTVEPLLSAPSDAQSASQ